VISTEQIMGMPVTIQCPDDTNPEAIEIVFDFLKAVDAKYSPYMNTSDVAKINRGELDDQDYDDELRTILNIAEQTKRETNGFFDVWHNDVFDPSGIVKGWAIARAAQKMHDYTEDFYLEIAGDIQVSGASASGEDWKIGIRNPFDRTQNISVVTLHNKGIATSGTAIRGQHIYNPKSQTAIDDSLASLSVIATDILDADRIATAAFAMGTAGIQYIEQLKGYEGYAVTKDRTVTMTSNWQKYEVAA